MQDIEMCDVRCEKYDVKFSFTAEKREAEFTQRRHCELFNYTGYYPGKSVVELLIRPAF